MAAHLDALRERLSAFYTAAVSDTGAHTVTFQPFLGKKIEDRVVAEEWVISGQRWVFLAVCDGRESRPILNAYRMLTGWMCHCLAQVTEAPRP